MSLQKYWVALSITIIVLVLRSTLTDLLPIFDTLPLMPAFIE